VTKIFGIPVGGLTAVLVVLLALALAVVAALAVRNPVFLRLGIRNVRRLSYLADGRCIIGVYCAGLTNDLRYSTGHFDGHAAGKRSFCFIVGRGNDVCQLGR